MNEPTERLESLILAVHRRNGGVLQHLDFKTRLLAPELRLDSLDLAELMAAIEREFGVSPFDALPVPRTWGDILELVRHRDNKAKEPSA